MASEKDILAMVMAESLETAKENNARRAAAAEPPSPLSGVKYTADFNIENFLKSNFPNAYLRCYANSTNQLIRHIPELFNGLAPLPLDQAALPKIGPLEFYRFVHRNMHITNPEQFRNKYIQVIEALLSAIGCPALEQDQSDFFGKLTSYGLGTIQRTPEQIAAKQAERQLILDAAIAADDGTPLRKWNREKAKQDIDNLKGEKTLNVHGPFYKAIIPHIGFKQVDRRTLKVSETCEDFVDINIEEKEEDEESFVTISANDYADGTPIQDFLRPKTIQASVPESILRKMIGNPECHAFITEYLADSKKREDNSKLLEARSSLGSQQAKYEFEKRKLDKYKERVFGDPKYGTFKEDVPATWNDSLYDWIADEQKRRKKAYDEELKLYEAQKASLEGQANIQLEEPKKPEDVKFADYINAVYDGKPEKVEYEELKGSIAAAKLKYIESEELLAGAENPSMETLREEGRQIEDRLNKDMGSRVLFKKTGKYFIVYIQYFILNPETYQPEPTPSATRFSNIRAPLTIPMTDDSVKTYVPISIVVHSGNSIKHGHYYTYNYIDEKAAWYKFDDGDGPGSPAEVVADVGTLDATLLSPDIQPTFVLYRLAEGGGGGAGSSKGGRRRSRRLKNIARRKTKARR